MAISENRQYQGTDGRSPLVDLYAADDPVAWRARARVNLTPIAAPSIMGLFGFMIATVMLGAWQAGWYGSAATPLVIWPLAMVAGGLLQMVAAIVSFRARDGVAVGVHTAWGSFWTAWGIMQILVATHVMAAIPLGTANPSFAFWFIVLALVTGICALASLAQNIGIATTLFALTGASAVTAAGFYAGNLGVEQAGGWLFVASAAAAWLTAGAMVLEHSFGRTIVPLGKWSKSANVPGRASVQPIAYREGMPGVKVGQ